MSTQHHEEILRTRERLQILSAIAAAIDNRHELIDIISACETAETALAQLSERLGFDALQARAVLDTQIVRFTSDGRDKITQDVLALQTQLER